MTESDKPELLNLEVDADFRPRSFAHAEMVTCEACLRANPPTRGNCLYCGAQLPATNAARTAEEKVAPAVAGAEGCYVVLSAAAAKSLDQKLLERLAGRLRIGLAELQTAIRAKGHLPLSHLNTDEQAQDVSAELRGLGIETSTVSGEDLKSSWAGKKIRALEIDGDGLTGLTAGSGERTLTAWDDPVLLVVGRLQLNHVEDVVRRKRGGPKPLDHRETSSDESIFDLYCRTSRVGWRIVASGFDFSCLGERKKMTAFENFTALIGLLGERAPNLAVDNSYSGVRPILTNLWPLGTSTRTGAWRRTGAGKIDMSTVTTTDNESQFDNYSRLLQVLRIRDLGRQNT
ncbi:MAG TPA: hypothetical protein VKD91_14945 [Pyrinomonadaceae bacterium]|nr:hypothetical protein [Pyrinomonadaceae bacterium]